jgi:hypothetical protein
MKVAAISPQFIIGNTSAAEELEFGDEAGPSSEITPVKEGQNNTQSRSALDEETRNGLRRLSRLLEVRKKKKLKGLMAYNKAAQPISEEAVGTIVDEVA